MAEYSWPKQGTAVLLGTEQDRIDGLEKATGAAKYSYDVVLDRMLIAKVLGCPHAHCKVKSIDVTAAKAIPGVVSIHLFIDPKDAKKSEIKWQGDPIACVAAETEGAAAEGVAALVVTYEVLEHFVTEEFLAAAERAGRVGKAGVNVELENEPGENEDEDAFVEKELKRLYDESAAVVEGYYGIQAITHMCLEPHGSTCAWQGDKLTAHLSTQSVSGTAGQFASPLSMTADDVTVHCDFIGGGFGSKFQADEWGVACAKIAKETGRPVKLMLDRDLELKVAGCRPSGFVKVKVGADKEGVVKVWDSQQWGTGGDKGAAVDEKQIPYVFNPPNRRRSAVRISTNTGPTRAWRAPNHPQACAISQTAYDDVAAKLGIDSYDVFLRNLPSVSNKKADVYAAEMEIAAKLMDWKAKWHPHGKGAAEGSIVTGLGMALHTWGGGAVAGSCLVKVHPDGGVETFAGSQDLGTGTRTVMAMVVAETFGLPIPAIKVNIGSSKYPQANPSGGSITVGSVSETHRRASQDALEKIKALVAEKLGVEAASLVARDGRIYTDGSPDKGVTWAQACSLLGMSALEVRGEYAPSRQQSPLSSSGVGGVQMAEVAVDRNTGLVRMKKFVAVQDIGLVINRQTAKSQIYGGVIMGIAYSLFEERIMDAGTGAFLNAQIADYRLPRLGDIGEIVVEFYEPESEYNRGVIGLGEPPVISPGAAISNAVANALGVRVPVLPITPMRVLDALESATKPA